MSTLEKLVNEMLKKLCHNIEGIAPGKNRGMKWSDDLVDGQGWPIEGFITPKLRDNEYIYMFGRVTFNTTFLRSEEIITDPKVLNRLCKEKIIKELEKILENHPIRCGKIKQWKKNNWTNIRVDLTVGAYSE